MASALYVLAAVSGLGLPLWVTDDNGPTRSLSVLGWSTEFTDLGLCFTLYPITVLTALAVMAYLDAGPRSVRAYPVAPLFVTATALIGAVLTLVLVIFAVDPGGYVWGDEPAPDGSRDRPTTYPWFPGAFTVSFLVAGGYATLRRAFAWKAPEARASWLSHLAAGTVPTLAVSVVALLIHVTT